MGGRLRRREAGTAEKPGTGRVGRTHTESYGGPGRPQSDGDARGEGRGGRGGGWGCTGQQRKAKPSPHVFEKTRPYPQVLTLHESLLHSLPTVCHTPHGLLMRMSVWVPHPNADLMSTGAWPLGHCPLGARTVMGAS